MWVTLGEGGEVIGAVAPLKASQRLQAKEVSTHKSKDLARWHLSTLR